MGGICGTVAAAAAVVVPAVAAAAAAAVAELFKFVAVDATDADDADAAAADDEVTAPPSDEVGRPRGLGPTIVPGGAVTRGDFFLLLFGVCDSISISSFGISCTLVRNSFSSVCAMTTTSSPGLLYT